MKGKIFTITILMLFLQAGSTMKAQVAETGNAQIVKDYAVVFDSLVTRLKMVAQDTNSWTGQTFTKIVKIFMESDVKIIRLGIYSRDNHEPPRHVYGIRLWLSSSEGYDYKSTHGINYPFIVMALKESKPYEKAFSLFQEYDGKFSEAVEAFYSDAVIHSIVDFYIPNKLLIPYSIK